MNWGGMLLETHQRFLLFRGVAVDNRLLFTIGYEGAEFADFLATLRTAAIDIVIDIRDVPISRKSGFSKRELADRLNTAGISYVHLKELGDPKAGREAARQGNIGEFEMIFNRHMEAPRSQEALSIAAKIASVSTACLLCFERDHARCHRSIVAAAISGRDGLRVRHIGVRRGLASRIESHREPVHWSVAVG